MRWSIQFSAKHFSEESQVDCKLGLQITCEDNDFEVWQVGDEK
jgi:hypothetical protein